MTDHGWEPPRQRPTNVEVREIVAAIIRHIDATPDWKPVKHSPAPASTSPVSLSSPDETYFDRGATP